ncbi:DUF968 domain-containing protein [Buttiauxella sp. B2]|uniref:DUF968 domain-containing protein n=1 Tax=Buttiauxella sp. B2 TaxID=2587812 RepID=UPI001120196A|nr:DUF968 domain-containing protein [Buttiauxella sp. B2]TNV14926.1 DUF968 domain-containing protein [Buttiauxella sp. B2]
MRALLKPVVVSELGMVIFRPGTELLSLFGGRVIIDLAPEYLSDVASGELPAARQALGDDPVLLPFFTNEKVVDVAGGLDGLEAWLMRQGKQCQWPHSDYHHHERVTTRFHPGALRLCWGCDNQLRDHYTEQLSSMATANVVAWIIDRARATLGFDESHVLTLPELCWWATKMDVVDSLPEGMARRALRMPQDVIPSVSRECDIVHELPATSIVQEKAKRVLALKVDPESPESFMLRPKRRRWESMKYTRWAKSEKCACCDNPADDPHHLIGYGQGGMATKAHDLFVIPLCRRHHDELHADVSAFEKKYGTQPELVLKTLDRALAIGVLA